MWMNEERSICSTVPPPNTRYQGQVCEALHSIWRCLWFHHYTLLRAAGGKLSIKKPGGHCVVISHGYVWESVWIVTLHKMETHLFHEVDKWQMIKHFKNTCLCIWHYVACFILHFPVHRQLLFVSLTWLCVLQEWQWLLVIGVTGATTMPVSLPAVLPRSLNY